MLMSNLTAPSPLAHRYCLPVVLDQDARVACIPHIGYADRVPSFRVAVEHATGHPL